MVIEVQSQGGLKIVDIIKVQFGCERILFKTTQLAVHKFRKSLFIISYFTLVNESIYTKCTLLTKCNIIIIIQNFECLNLISLSFFLIFNCLMVTK